MLLGAVNAVVDQRESLYPQPAEYDTLSSELCPSVTPSLSVSESTTSISDAFAVIFFYLNLM